MNLKHLIITIFFISLFLPSIFSEETFPGKKGEWNGFTRYDFHINKQHCIVVLPKTVAKGKPWIWRARFFGHEPQLDIALLNKGFHLVYCKVKNLFGSPTAVKHWDAFYEFLTTKHGFASKAVLEGMSRGGLIIYNWAAANPDKVLCIYGDNPVCDFRSWPGPKGGGTWKKCINAYGLTDEEAMKYEKQPIHNLAPIAKAKIPIIHVVGDADVTVPIKDNSNIIEERYKKLGGTIKVIHKPTGHHPHSLKNPKPLVDFIMACF